MARASYFPEPIVGAEGIEMPLGFAGSAGALAPWQALILFLLLMAWLIVGAATRAQARMNFGYASGQSRDRGSLGVLLFTALVAVVGSAVVSEDRLWLLPNALFYVGVALIILGIVIRNWAISQLGRHFSPVVRTGPEQQIVRTGFYRIIRHPAYTGMFLTLMGFAIAWASALGILIALAALSIGFAYRIHVEEAALAERFGDEYREYAKSTWRLIPYVI